MNLTVLVIEETEDLHEVIDMTVGRHNRVLQEKEEDPSYPLSVDIVADPTQANGKQYDFVFFNPYNFGPNTPESIAQNVEFMKAQTESGTTVVMQGTVPEIIYRQKYGLERGTHYDVFVSHTHNIPKAIKEVQAKAEKQNV